MANSPKNVCIFGLSANPPTGLLGHQGIVKKLIGLEKFDEIWILPVYRHVYTSKRSLASFEHRMEMCKLNFEKLSKFPECRVVVKPTERTVCKRRMNQDPSNQTGTADILDFLTGAYPTTKFSLALGADSYLDLVGGKWTRSDALAKHIQNRFEVVARECSKDHVDEALEDMVDAQNAKANSIKEEGGTKEAITFGATLHHLPQCQADISSTQVRAQLAELEAERHGVIDDDSPLRNEMLIDSEVLGYCRSHGLYNPIDDKGAEYQSEETKRRDRELNGRGGLLGGWGKWLVVMLTLTAILLAFLGVSYSSSTGLVLPPILGGELASPLLTIHNLEEVTNGKMVFVKFMAPWCGHCKQLKPNWDALASSVNKQEDGGLGHVLVADVDCTSTDGRPLCDEHGVGGFPTLKYGDFSGALDEYEGGRKLSELKEFVLQLAPPCTPDSIDQCSTEDRNKLNTFLAYSKEQLDGEIQKYENKKKDAAMAFEQGVDQLKATHRELVETKENILKAIRGDGLKNARAVKAARTKS